MKRVLLGLAFTLAISANAQQTISFETSEGYTVGAAEGQGIIVPLFGANEEYPSDISTVSITNNDASHLVQSLQFVSDGSEWLYQDGIAIPVGNLTGKFQVSFDILLESDEDSEVVIAGLQGADFLYGSYLSFDYFGDVNTRQGATLSDVATYTPGDWMNVKIDYDFTAGTLTYSIDDVEISTGAKIGTTTGIDQIFFGYDNYNSGFLIDNIVITQAPAGTSDFVKNNFTVFPNPATDVLNLNGINNASINNVSITDVNGRTVKQQNLNGVSSAQINVNDLTPGVYFVSVDAAQGKGTTKFVKK